MDEQITKLMTIKTKESDSGMFFATSEDEPTFFVSAVSADQLWLAIPAALEDLFQEMAAFPTNKGTFASRPWALVPKELMRAKALEPEAAHECR